MRKALITGINGFSAKHLARRLMTENIQVLGVDIQQAPHPDTACSQYYQCDITDSIKLGDIIKSEQPDYVFHLAGLIFGSDLAIYQTNFLGLINLLEALRQYSRQSRVLIVGSSAEYGYLNEQALPVGEDYPCQPVGAYGISKYAGTTAALDYARRTEMKIVIARPFNIIGAGVPSSLVVGALLQRAKVALESSSDPVVKIGNLDSERDFISVDDVVDAYIKMVNGDFWGEIFNICSGKSIPIRVIAEKLLANSHRPIRLKVDPALVRSTETNRIFGDCAKASKSFAFNPDKDIQTALRSAWDHVIGNPV